MSVHLDPQSKVVAQFEPQEATSAKNIFQHYFSLCLEGLRMEVTPSKTYCQEKWESHQVTETDEKAKKAFMKTCKSDCESYKQFANWHRLS